MKAHVLYTSYDGKIVGIFGVYSSYSLAYQKALQIQDDDERDRIANGKPRYAYCVQEYQVDK